MAASGDQPDWEDLRCLLATARGGSARAAGVALGVSHSTVARRIEAFEARLGARLFDRTAGGYAITATGERLRRHAERMEAIAIDAGRVVDGSDDRLEGRVRLTLPYSVAHTVLMPDLAAFAERYPHIDLDIETSDSPRDIVRREADVALRFVPLGNSPPEPLIGRHVGRSCNGAYARPDYLATHSLHGPDASARWLGWDERVARPDWIERSELVQLDARHGFPEPLLQISAARHALGVAFVPCCLGDAEPALVQVPGTGPVPRFDIWILSHPDLRDTARLRAVRDHLAAAVTARANAFLGVDS